MKQQAFLKRIPPTSLSFSLLVLSAAVIAIHFTLLWKFGNSDRQVSSLLFWSTAAYLLWESQEHLNFQAKLIPSSIGALLLGILLLKTIGYCEESFLMAYPFIAGIALALIASGFRGLKIYWRQLLLLFCAGFLELLMAKFADPAPLTAQFAASTLWFSGLNVVLNGTYLQLPGGTVHVYSGCSGNVTMNQLFGLSVLFLMLLPLPWKWYQKAIIPPVAVAIAFFVNMLRVALMAILVAEKQMDTFDYWHNGQGSLVFSGIATFFLVVFIKILIELLKPPQSPAPPSSEGSEL
jgi:cyanoexosortase A